MNKLLVYLDVSKAKNLNNLFNKNDVLSVSGDYGIVNQIEFQGRSFAGASVSNYGVVYTGDIVYTKSPLKANPFGIIKTNKGKAGIVSTLYAVYKPKSNVHPDFIQVYFNQNERLNKYLQPLVNKGAKNDMKVSDENALKGEVCFPGKDEQIKISCFLSCFDSLISLHKKKIDLFKKYKRGLLLKIFPKPGYNIPSLRFKKFSDLWSKISFENILEEFSNKSTIENQFDILSSTNTGIEKRKGRVSGDSNIGYKIINTGDLVLSPQNLWLGNININNLQKGLVSPSYKTFKITGVDIDFLEPQLHMQYLLNQYILSSVQGASVVRRNLNPELFKKITILVPSSEEQYVIGKIIKHLDRKISYEEESLFILKQYKAGLLRQMFI